jgi:hypothetical protein
MSSLLSPTHMRRTNGISASRIFALIAKRLTPFERNRRHSLLQLQQVWKDGAGAKGDTDSQPQHAFFKQTRTALATVIAGRADTPA